METNNGLRIGSIGVYMCVCVCVCVCVCSGDGGGGLRIQSFDRNIWVERRGRRELFFSTCKTLTEGL